MKIIYVFTTGFMMSFMACNTKSAMEQPIDQKEISATKTKIANLLDAFNLAAANADYTAYFNFFTKDAIFIGTDATENWTKDSFMVWAKPHFDKKKTWNFTAFKRHIFLDKTNTIAWFDELLNTQMKICRGSGVLVKQGAEWKIQQYVLSMTIPNDFSDKVTAIKAPIEDSLLAIFTNREKPH